MTREFHIKGIPGLLIFILMVAVVLLILIAVPSALFMVVWNAIIFEGFKGPAIHLFQGVLLTIITAVALKIVCQPVIELHFRKATNEELEQLQSFVESYHVPDENEEVPVITTSETLMEQPVEVKATHNQHLNS